MVRVSDRLLSLLRQQRANGVPQYRIARRAGVHPATVSLIVNDGLPLRAGDPRVVAIGRELGLEPDECFVIDVERCSESVA